MNEYLEQAQDFCKKYNVVIKVEFLCKDYYVDGDKEKRDIYNVTINRNSRKTPIPYSFKFGSSLSDTEKNYDRNGKRKYRNLTIPSEYDILACFAKI